MPAANRIRIRLCAPVELTDGLIAEWRSIQSSRRELMSPFFSPEFTLAVASARHDAEVAIIEDNGQVRGFFPFHRWNNNVGKPIGGPISDYQGVIAHSDLDLAPADLLSGCGLKAYDFNHAPSDQRTLIPGAFHFAQSPHLDLSQGYEAYLEARPKAGKHAIKETERRIRKLEREYGPLRFVWHDDTAEAWTGLVEMKNAAYKRIGLPSILDFQWVQRVLAEIRSRRGAEFSGLLSTVYAGDKLIAAHMGMRSASTIAWWFNTYDEELRNLAPGLILLLMAAQRAHEEGISLIDFGKGDEHYKLTFANGAIPICEGSIEMPRTIVGGVRRLQKFSVRSCANLPLGRYQSIPRRAMSRYITHMRLPEPRA